MVFNNNKRSLPPFTSCVIYLLCHFWGMALKLLNSMNLYIDLKYKYLSFKFKI